MLYVKSREDYKWLKSKSIRDAITSNKFVFEFSDHFLRWVRFLASRSSTPQYCPEQRQSRRTMNSVFIAGNGHFIPIYCWRCSTNLSNILQYGYIVNCQIITVHSSSVSSYFLLVYCIMCNELGACVVFYTIFYSDRAVRLVCASSSQRSHPCGVESVGSILTEGQDYAVHGL